MDEQWPGVLVSSQESPNSLDVPASATAPQDGWPGVLVAPPAAPKLATQPTMDQKLTGGFAASMAAHGFGGPSAEEMAADRLGTSVAAQQQSTGAGLPQTAPELPAPEAGPTPELTAGQSLMAGAKQGWAASAPAMLGGDKNAAHFMQPGEGASGFVGEQAASLVGGMANPENAAVNYLGGRLAGAGVNMAKPLINKVAGIAGAKVATVLEHMIGGASMAAPTGAAEKAGEITRTDPERWINDPAGAIAEVAAAGAKSGLTGAGIGGVTGSVGAALSTPEAAPKNSLGLLRDRVRQGHQELTAEAEAARSRTPEQRQADVTDAEQAASENPELFKAPSKATTPEELAAKDAAIKSEADTAESIVPKDEVANYAGENVDKDTLGRLIEEEPGDFVKTTVTPADFADIPRSNLDIGKAQEYAQRDTKAPPIIATMNDKGELQVRDGRHRLIAAALRDQATVGDPYGAAVDAIVPKRWLDAREAARKPIEVSLKEAVSPRGETVPSVENAPKTGGVEEAPPIQHAMGAATQGSIAGARLDAAIRAITGHAKVASQHAHDAIMGMRAAVSRDAMPKTTTLGKDSADAGVRYAAAAQSVKPMAKAAVSEVLPTNYGDKTFRMKLGAVLTEGRLQAERQKFLANGQTAEAAQVGTLIGKTFPDAAAYKAARADPAIQDAIKRHMQIVQPAAEAIHTALGGKLSVKDESGAFINLKAIDPTDPLDKREMPPGQGRGNLRNPKMQKSAFAIPAKGTAKAYQLDYARIVENTIGRNAERFAKKNYVEQLVKDKLAEVMTPREAHQLNFNTFEKWPTINGRRAARIEGVVDYAYATDKEGETPHAVQVKKDLYVDPRIESEVRSAFNLDKPIMSKGGLNLIPKVITHAQLMGPVDFVYHTARIFAQITNSPGGKSFLGDLTRKIPGVNVLDTIARIGANVGKVIQDSPEIHKQLAELSQIGAMRDSKGVLGTIDKAGRLALDNMYDNLVKRGLAENTEANRRNFSNQVGQYNGRLQTRIVRELKESGLSPFITAGLSGNLEGIKAAAGSPVVKGKTKAATTQLVATQLAGHVISLGVIPAAVNMVMTGKISGRPGVPLGAIDTGKTDEDGKPIFIDPMKWVGVRRGLRVTGIDAAAERLRTGGSATDALNDAWRGALQSWVHPFAGPAVHAAVTAGTGFDTSGRRASPVVKPGESQVMQNFKTALEQANPTVNAFISGKREGGAGKGIAEAVSSLRSAVGVGSRKPVSEGAKQGAQLNDFRDDLKRRAKQLPTSKRMEFIKGEIKGLPGPQKMRIIQDIQEHPHSWMSK